ncbi:DUF5801 repeats-in-toxin domain-containing protein, partial [Desulfomicrobium apsheronum]|uniref:DUF5801 repeats-in-toxin domain-containing protein n=1 Tax=Desulfomicrobium apsheronum TaxID=52560 RepID=UPI0015A724DE
LTLSGDGTTLLKTAQGDFAITLVETGDQTIEGQYQDDGTQTAFTVSIGVDGKLTVTQYVALEHNDDGDTVADYDDTLDLSGLISATVTITDGDGDTASGSAEIGGAVTFYDDGPSLGTLSSSVASEITHDETPGLQDGGVPDKDDVNPDLVSFEFAHLGTPLGAAQDIVVSMTLGGAAAYGADGAGDTKINGFSLTTSEGNDFDGVPTGLQATNGDSVFLFTEGNLVVGREGGETGDPVFALQIDSTGKVTLVQYQAIDHGEGNGAEDATTGADEYLSLTNLVYVTTNVTVTDGDGDYVTGNVTSGDDLTINFYDDGPVIHSVMDGVLSNAAEVAFTGSYSADFGADGLNYMSVALEESGFFGGVPVSFDHGTTINGVTPVAVLGAGETVLNFYYTTTISNVADGGDGSVVLNAYTIQADPAGSQFFELVVKGDGTYSFEMISNEILSNTTVTGGDFDAFGPITQVSTADQSLVIYGSAKVNASDNGIGIQQPTIGSGEWIKLDFSSMQKYVSFTLQQWTSTGSASVQLMIDNVVYDFYPLDDARENVNLSKPASSVLTFEVVVDAEQAGTWGLNGSVLSVYVANEFESLQFDHEGGGENFNINNITYDLITTIEDISFNFELSVTDLDGDSFTLNDSLTIAMIDSADDLDVSSVVGIDAHDGVVLLGNGEDDVLIGGDGDDVLIGGIGDDIMTGGLGSDIFKYVESDLDGSIDHILDFSVASSGGDMLDLGEILEGYAAAADKNAFFSIQVQPGSIDTVAGTAQLTVGVDSDGATGGALFTPVAQIEITDFSGTSEADAVSAMLDHIVKTEMP